MPTMADLNQLAMAMPQTTKEVSDDGRLDETFVDGICDPPEVFTYGGMVAHVLTFAAHRRTLVCGMAIASWLRSAIVVIRQGYPTLSPYPTGSATHRMGSPLPRSVTPASASAPQSSVRRWAAKVSTWATMPP